MEATGEWEGVPAGAGPGTAEETGWRVKCPPAETCGCYWGRSGVSDTT